jgi:hypothetical protein
MMCDKNHEHPDALEFELTDPYVPNESEDESDEIAADPELMVIYAI